MKSSSDKYISEAMKNKLKDIKADEALISSTLELIRNADSGNTPTRLSAIDSNYVSENTSTGKINAISASVIAIAIAICTIVTGICILKLVDSSATPSESEAAIIQPDPDRVIYRPYAVPVSARGNEAVIDHLTLLDNEPQTKIGEPSENIALADSADE